MGTFSDRLHKTNDCIQANYAPLMLYFLSDKTMLHILSHCKWPEEAPQRQTVKVAHS